MIPRCVSPTEFDIRESMMEISTFGNLCSNGNMPDYCLRTGYHFAAYGANRCPHEDILAALEGLEGAILEERGGEAIEALPYDPPPHYRAHEPWDGWATYVLLSATLRLAQMHGGLAPKTLECWRFALDRLRPEEA